jgi:RES domain-containing protein
MPLKQRRPFAAIPGAVLPASWNLLFNPMPGAGKHRLRDQTDCVLDTRLNPPRA